MDGVNPVYTDLGTGASWIVGSGFTRGPITNSNLVYDPSNKGVSHISFYTAVPEPGSVTLLSMGILGFLGIGLSRRNDGPIREDQPDRRRFVFTEARSDKGEVGAGRGPRRFRFQGTGPAV
jgi:hypothetical protein